jgi:hypothetical protein
MLVGGRRHGFRGEREHGHIIGARQCIVHERCREQLPVLVEDDTFRDRLPDALRHAAMHLTFGQHRVDQVAEIVDDGVAAARSVTPVSGSISTSATWAPFG